MTFRRSLSRENAAYGGFADAIGGIATIVLAVLGLAGVRPTMMVAVATVIFGVALLIQVGTMLSEYASTVFPPGAIPSSIHQFGGSSLSIVFMVGAAGIVLGILALLGIHAVELVPVAIIAFGAALALSSNAVWHLYVIKQATSTTTEIRIHARRTRNPGKRIGLGFRGHSGARRVGRGRARHTCNRRDRGR